MYGSSKVDSMYGSSKVDSMYGSSKVDSMYGSSKVDSMSDSSKVYSMYGSSKVDSMYGSSKVDSMYGSSKVDSMYGSSKVDSMSDSSKVDSMYDSSKVEMWGEAFVSAFSCKEIICHGYNIVSIRKSNKKKCTIIMNKTSHLIIIPDPEPIFKDYIKRYPVEIKGKKAIMYKAAHKKKVGNKIVYFSDYDKDFKYEINKVIKVECDKSIDIVCSNGIHIFHKFSAIKWGSGWSDFALLECEIPISKIIVPKNHEGKIRTGELKVIKEITDYEN